MCILPVYLEGTGFWCFLFSFNILLLLIKKEELDTNFSDVQEERGIWVGSWPSG